MRPVPPRVLGLALLGAFALHASTKDAAHLQEMLWMCHVATVLMALGLLAGRHMLVAMGLLLHMGFGTYSWLLDAVVTGETTLSSTLVHVLPLVAGGLEVRRQGWPRGMVWRTWLFFTPWVPFCRLVTDPALNVNLSHAAWGPMADVMGGVYLSWVLNNLAMLGGFLLANAVLRRIPSPLGEGQGEGRRARLPL